MSKLPTIFLSYNPNSEFEETLAVRLHTIGAVHGFMMQLPDRYSNNTNVSIETRNRIVISNYFILFSTASKLSKTVKDEIDIAYKHLKDKTKVIVIYDKHKGKNLTGADNCTEIYIDSKEPLENILEGIVGKIKEQENKKRPLALAKNDSSGEVLAGILLAGLALLILGALLSGSSKGNK